MRLSQSVSHSICILAANAAMLLSIIITTLPILSFSRVHGLPFFVKNDFALLTNDSTMTLEEARRFCEKAAGKLQSRNRKGNAAFIADILKPIPDQYNIGAWIDVQKTLRKPHLDLIVEEQHLNESGADHITGYANSKHFVISDLLSTLIFNDNVFEMVSQFLVNQKEAEKGKSIRGELPILHTKGDTEFLIRATQKLLNDQLDSLWTRIQYDIGDNVFWDMGMTESVSVFPECSLIEFWGAVMEEFYPNTHNRSISDCSFWHNFICKDLLKVIRKSRVEILERVNKMIAKTMKEFKEGLSENDKECIKTVSEEQIVNVHDEMMKNHTEMMEEIRRESHEARTSIEKLDSRVSALQNEFDSSTERALLKLRNSISSEVAEKFSKYDAKRVSEQYYNEKRLIQLGSTISEVKESTEKQVEALSQGLHKQMEKLRRNITNKVDMDFGSMRMEIPKQHDIDFEKEVDRILNEKMDEIKKQHTQEPEKDLLLGWKIFIGFLAVLYAISIIFLTVLFRKVKSLKQKVKEATSHRSMREEARKRKFINNDLQVKYDNRMEQASISKAKMLI